MCVFVCVFIYNIYMYIYIYTCVYFELQCMYSISPHSCASNWHVSDLLNDVLCPVVNCLMYLHSTARLCVQNEPVYTCG